MSKKNWQTATYREYTHGNAVDVMSIDDIAVLSDDDLYQRGDRINNELKSKHYPQGSKEAEPYETELAYLVREQQIRNARHDAHRKYLETLRADDVDENSLPEYQGNPMNWS